MKKTTALLLAISMLFTLCACGHEHSWTEASCTEPKTCAVCGATEGEPLGHSWTEATCTEPRTCDVCGATEGEPLGHEISLEVLSMNVVAATRIVRPFCAVCGEEYEVREEKLESFVEDGIFLFTPEEFLRRLQMICDEKTGGELRFVYGPDISIDMFRIDLAEGRPVGLGGFYDAEFQPMGLYDERPVCGMRLIFIPRAPITMEDVVAVLKKLVGPCVCAADPSVENGEEYADAVLDNRYSHFKNEGGEALHGIYYSGSLSDRGNLWFEIYTTRLDSVLPETEAEPEETPAADPYVDFWALP